MKKHGDIAQAIKAYMDAECCVSGTHYHMGHRGREFHFTMRVKERNAYIDIAITVASLLFHMRDAGCFRPEMFAADGSSERKEKIAGMFESGDFAEKGVAFQLNRLEALQKVEQSHEGWLSHVFLLLCDEVFRVAEEMIGTKKDWEVEYIAIELLHAFLFCCTGASIIDAH